VFDPTELIRLSIALENDLDPRGDLRPLPGRDSALFSISRHAGGHLALFRYDLPQDVRQRIAALSPDRQLYDHETVRQILAQHLCCDSVFAGRAYWFAHSPAPEEHPDVVFRDGCHTVLADGQPVSWAWTAVESAQAAELAVETASGHRQRGYGRQVAAAWAAQVRSEGKVAFYSHELGNAASEALATSLGVVQYALVTSYEVRVAPA
jgi:hypothetical protein